METAGNKKPYLVELSNQFGRYFQQVQFLTEKEAVMEKLKGFDVLEVEKLDGIYVRKLK